MFALTLTEEEARQFVVAADQITNLHCVPIIGIVANHLDRVYHEQTGDHLNATVDLY